MKGILVNKRKSILFIKELLSKNYFKLKAENNNYDKRLDRIELKLKKLMIEEGISELQKQENMDEKVLLLEEKKKDLKKEIKETEKALFNKDDKVNIVNKKFVIVTNNKGFNSFTFNDEHSILNKKDSYRNMEFWLSNLPKNVCKKAYYNYFLQCNDSIDDLSRCINYAEEEMNLHEENHFINELIKDYDMTDDYSIIDFLDYNFFNEKDSLNLLKLIVSNKCIGDLDKKDISLKCYKPSKHILGILNPILNRRINSLYEFKFKDLKILLAEVNKL